MKNKLLLLLLFLSIGLNASFGQITPIRTDVSGFATWTDNNVIGTTYLQLLVANASTDSPAMDFNSFTNETLNFQARTFGGTNATENQITVSISTDNGSNWTVIGTRTPTSATLTAQASFDLSSYNGTQVKVRFSVAGSSNTVGAGIDNIAITGTAGPAVPVVSNGSTSGIVGSAFTTYNLSTLSTNSPTSYNYVSGALPSGLSINLTTGAITGTPTAGGAFTYTFTATNGVGTSASSATLTLTIAIPVPEINLKRASGASIPSGSAANSGFDTIFAAQTIGNSGVKTYTIENTGTGVLNISTIASSSSNFTIAGITLPATIAASNSTTFTVTFTPVTSGTLSGTITINNDDSNEGVYTFGVQGTGNCASIATTITPSTAPIGTEVTITATTNNISGATILFNGVAATSITQVSSTVVKAVIPAGATTGNMTITNAQGCTTSPLYTIIDKAISSCQGGGATPSDLFISQMTDSDTGSLSYIEIYNGTGTTINLATYKLDFYSNGSTTQNGGSLALNNVNLITGGIYIVAVGVDTSAPYNTCSGANDQFNGTLANQTSGLGGVNFNGSGGNDHIKLMNGTTAIDSWGVYLDGNWANTTLSLGTQGADFRRKPTATVPSTSYSNADWDVIDWASCVDNEFSTIGLYDFSTAIPPAITAQPTYSQSCDAILSVTGIEGYNGVGDINELSYQWFVNIPGNASWSALTDTGVYSGTSTANLSISSTSGLNNYQYYCQVREDSATCFVASNAIKIQETTSTTWNGTTWSNGVPSISTPAIFTGNYTSTGDLFACRLLVTNNANVIIDSGFDCTVHGIVTVDSGSTLTFNNNANLLQETNVINVGNISMKRSTNPLMRLDYTIWSGPVTGQNLLSFSPNTLTNRFYTYNTSTNLYNTVNPSITNFTPGAGFQIRTPNTHPLTPTTWTGTFTGVPNNGNYSVALTNIGAGQRFNVVGNPYPSPIDMNLFTTLNNSITGTLYFWRKTNSTVTSNRWSTWNSGTFVASPGPEPFVTDPNDIIRNGQGFLVEASPAGTSLVFNNSMRISDNSNQFFRFSNAEKSRIWLNATTPSGAFCQQAISYLAGGTNGVDNKDGLNFNNTELLFTSIIPQMSDRYAIQSRQLPFDVNDVIPLSFNTLLSGEFSIAIDHKDGLFAGNTQDIFIKDNYNNTYTNINNGSYEFVSNAGIFDDRFELRFISSLLNINQNTFDESSVIVYNNNNNDIVIKNIGEFIYNVNVYDVRGRLLFTKDKINKNEFTVSLDIAKEVILVTIISETGKKITKKIVH